MSKFSNSLTTIASYSDKLLSVTVKKDATPATPDKATKVTTSLNEFVKFLLTGSEDLYELWVSRFRGTTITSVLDFLRKYVASIISTLPFAPTGLALRVASSTLYLCFDVSKPTRYAHSVSIHRLTTDPSASTFYQVIEDVFYLFSYEVSTLMEGAAQLRSPALETMRAIDQGKKMSAITSINMFAFFLSTDPSSLHQISLLNVADPDIHYRSLVNLAVMGARSGGLFTSDESVAQIDHSRNSLGSLVAIPPNPEAKFDYEIQRFQTIFGTASIFNYSFRSFNDSSRVYTQRLGNVPVAGPSTLLPKRSLTQHSAAPITVPILQHTNSWADPVSRPVSPGPTTDTALTASHNDLFNN